MYLDLVAAAIMSKCGERKRSMLPLYRIYAVLCLSASRGSVATNADIHDAWVVWRVSQVVEHSCFIPYEELREDIADLDTLYRVAVNDVAIAIREQGLTCWLLNNAESVEGLVN